MGGETPGWLLTDGEAQLIEELRNRRRTETEHQLMMTVFKLIDAVKSERNAALDAAIRELQDSWTDVDKSNVASILAKLKAEAPD